MTRGEVKGTREGGEEGEEGGTVSGSKGRRVAERKRERGGEWETRKTRDLEKILVCRDRQRWPGATRGEREPHQTL